MTGASHITSTTNSARGLRREIIWILGVKLIGLMALYFLFFDQRPDITPSTVEQRVLRSTDASAEDRND